MSEREQSSGEYPKWVTDKVRWLEYSHLGRGSFEREVSKKFCMMAYDFTDAMLAELNSSNEDQFAIDQFLIALQRIIDAKDAAVRAALSIKLKG